MVGLVEHFVKTIVLVQTQPPAQSAIQLRLNKMYMSQKATANTRLQDLLTKLFHDGSFKTTNSEIKIHVDSMESEGILQLANLVRIYEIKVTLKRSGTGITIIVQDK
jgi:hypothetical protein